MEYYAVGLPLRFPVVLLACATILATADCLASGHLLPRGVQETASVEGITEYTFANGLRCLLFPDSSKETVTVNITYLVGSRFENYGETGMAHLLEHLMFKGTRKYGNIFRALSSRGMDFNGSTSFDRTNYHESFPASDSNLRWALAMEADRMTHSFIAKRDLVNEMPVVRNEMEEGENDPQGVLTEKMQAASFQWHNYGKSTIGARSDVEGADIAHLQAFYRRYYQPDDAVLLVSGNFNPKRTLAWIADDFGAIPRPRRVLEPTHTLDPSQEGEREIVLRRAGSVQVVETLYHIVPGAHADYPAVEVLANVLGDAPSGRLYHALVETGQASSVFAESDPLRDPGVLVLGAQVRQGASLDPVKQTLISTVEGVASQRITQVEFDRARTKLLKDIDLSMNDPEQVGIALSEDIAAGDWRLFFVFRDRLRSLNLVDVQRVAESYLKRSNRTLGSFIPAATEDRAPSPVQVDITAAVKAYRGGPLVDPGESFVATPSNIDARTEPGVLSNGLRYALLPKRTRGNMATLVLHLHLGDEHSLFGREAAGRFASAMLLRGTAKHSRQELEDAFDRLKTSVSIDGNETHVTVSLETTRSHFDDTLRLLAEVLQDPLFAPAEFAMLKNAQLTSLEAALSDPQSLAAEVLDRHGNPYPHGDVRYVESLREQIASVTSTDLNEVQTFYREFYGASNAELAIVGDFDPIQTKASLKTLWDSWKSPRPYTRVPMPLYPIPPAELEVAIPDKANAVLITRLGIKLSDQDDSYPALLIGNYILGGSGNSRLVDRARQTEGISYSISSFVTADSFEPNGAFGFYASYAPQNRKRLELAMTQEIQRLLRDGVSTKEVRQAASALAQERRLGLSQDLSLADLLARHLELGRTMAYTEKIDQAIAQVTVAQVNSVLRKYVQPQAFTTVCVGDFSTKTP